MNKPDPFKKLFAHLAMNGAKTGGHRADNSKREINITVDDLRRKFEEQDGCCYWTGMKLDMNDIFESHNMATPSVDRLDNDRGYDYANIVITSRFFNVGRGRMSLPRTHDLIRRLMQCLPEHIVVATSAA